MQRKIYKNFFLQPKKQLNEGLLREDVLGDILFSEFTLVGTRGYNACLQKPKPRPDDGQQPLTNLQTVMREEYCKTAERGFGRLQGFVSTSYSINILFSDKHTQSPER